MSKKQVKSPKKKSLTDTPSNKSVPAGTSKTSSVEFALGKENYILLTIGFIVIIVGFLLMIGGAPENPNDFNPEVFSWRRITLAPVVVLFGFIFEIYAIMKKPDDNSFIANLFSKKQ
ncbi:MAG: DUF3098 domain-containing protein [Bacteroidetes bacterium]|jgi:hypothetical protein|nr:DUF3098 domain-containing protein [Bacteroidota bacterium]MBT6685374.1 DUF3098 domain-containing protein [Bacteroidota bacterium]MBT7145046.1 DUF3098 domain-containing protein [Bacteroidota bacterium]MBT7492731.1 DUF3098 domain-containing protein [Bacteroidota bacterium]